jgi:hypothetical protein
MAELKFVCPSKGRAANHLTSKLIDDLIIVVPAAEVDEYREHIRNAEILGCDEKGITMTRQWCLNKFKELFFIDDDVTKVLRKFEMKRSECSQQEIRSFVNETCFISREIGAKMYGYKAFRHVVDYSGLELFGLTGYWNHSFVGYNDGHGLTFDPSYSEAEDYYMSCLNIYKNRYGLIDARYLFVTKQNFALSGGCMDYRTTQAMVNNTKKLIAAFGSDIVRFKRKTYSKKNIHLGERSLLFPF